MKYEMKEYETFKVYGKKLNVWKETVKVANGYEYDKTTQVELAYKTFDYNGKVVGEGSEDFSVARMDNSLTYYEIWTWDGEKLNRGGYRWFECRRRVRINRSDLPDGTVKAKTGDDTDETTYNGWYGSVYQGAGGGD